ncbi:hypothetical protein V5T82_14580 [Magnetovibrio sp. PR-2]|uniref:hypothetical protein n=1 Tax=Magnetovibrio sp. PR-2 TaxID=3120356 RepID=UPI002FCE2848
MTDTPSVRRPVLGTLMLIAGLLCLGISAVLLVKSHFGPFFVVEGHINVAATMQQGGTRLRGGGGDAVVILLKEDLTPTPYPPEFSLTLSLSGSESFHMAQRLPRGTAVKLFMDGDDLQDALTYAQTRHATEQSGQVYSGFGFWQVEGLVHLHKIEWMENGDIVSAHRTFTAIWFWTAFLVIIGFALSVEGRAHLVGKPVSPDDNAP